MSPLIRKEIRLLLPAWVAAMLPVIAPVPLGPLFEYYDPAVKSTVSGTANLTLLGLAAGCILLGLAGFGREMSSRTFSFLLAQPRPRGECWRAKIAVLFGLLAPIALFLGLVSWRFVLPSMRWQNALTWFVTVCVAVTGGLWTTLLLRQVVASFWISLLVPVTLIAAAMQVENQSIRLGLTTVLLLVYSLAGYLFGRWQFLNAQDTAWTGGNVSLPGIARWLPVKRAATPVEKTRPLWALLGKEFQFQQINFLIAGLVLLVQLAVLVLQGVVQTSESSVLDMIIQYFWGTWIFLPLLVGCGAVAEERRLGTSNPSFACPWPADGNSP